MSKKEVELENRDIWGKIGKCSKCGCSDKIAINNTFLENWFYVSCYNCRHKGLSSSSFREAVEAWNSEAKEPDNA